MRRAGEMDEFETDGPTPILRFPEFEEEGAWDRTSLHRIASPVKDKATGGNNEDTLTLSGEMGLVPQGDYFGKQISGENVSRYIKIVRDDFVYNDRTTKASKFGSIKRLTSTDGGVVSPIYKCFRFNGGQNPDFWDYYFEAQAHEVQLGGLVNEGARAGRFNISIDKFLSIDVWKPSPPEQERIAECLSSIDALIEVETEKLDALKDHKQGLMLELFPVKGVSLPKRRLSKFRDGEQWKVCRLGDLFDITSGGTPNRSRPDYWGGDIPWVSTSLVDFNTIRETEESITQNGLSNSSAKIFPAGTVVMAMYGQGKTRGQVAFLGIDAATNQACAAILPNPKVKEFFVFQTLAGRYREIREMSNGGGQDNLSLGIVGDIDFSYPEDVEEQSAIVDMLNSIDQMIWAQARKLNRLKYHKAGLLHQLFPVLGEVQG